MEAIGMTPVFSVYVQYKQPLNGCYVLQSI